MSHDITERKLRHIEACLSDEVLFHSVTAGFETVEWPYRALPERDLASVDLSTTFLGRSLRAPLLIGAMTGGAERAALINRNLAIAAQELGIGLMLGSQRVMLERPEARASFEVRSYAPDVLLIGNIGGAQFLKGYGAEHLRRAADLVGADAVAVHVNPLQEAFQEGGDTDWRGLTARLAEVVPDAGIPVLLKEVGHGLSGDVVRSVAGVGFAALDVAGAGGTSWAKVEDLVRHGRITRPDLAELGVPTVRALRESRAAAPNVPLVASGGVRTGLDVAKALTLGASVCALARPLLRPALDSPEAVVAALSRVIEDLRVALFVAGYASADEARAAAPHAP